MSTLITDDEYTEEWDFQIDADFSDGGAGVPLLAEWGSEIDIGQCLTLDQFLDSESQKSSSILTCGSDAVLDAV